MYFLKSAACLAVLLLFYKLLLERENMHIFKRFYLLTSVVAAIIIPLITFTSYIEPSSETFRHILITSEGVSKEASVNYLPYILTGIYVLGVLFFSIKFFRNLSILILKIRKNPKIKKKHVINVLLSEKIQPHTFFSFIFFNKKKYLNDEIPKDVKIHEEAHARQKHSMDVIFVELLQIVFWINPLIFLLKNAIKLNHEFLADRAVLRQGYSTAGYQQTLLQYSSGDLQSDLVNPINYSSIKKRFTVMKTQTSKSAVWAKGLLILPLIAVLCFGFSNKEMVEKEINAFPVESISAATLILEVDENGKIFLQKSEVEIAELRKYVSNRSYTSYHIEVAENSSPFIMKDLIQLMAENKLQGSVATCTSKIDQQKATPEMIKEHNKLVKHYNSIPKEEFKMEKEVINRIMYIRSLMTPEQKRNAEKITFDVPPPPPPAPAPHPEMNADNIAPPPPPRAPKPEMNADNIAPPPPPRAPKPEMNADNIAPPPPPPSYKDLVERGATFYYNGKEIKPEEARKLVEVEKKVNVQISDFDGKPEVRLTDKEK